MTHLFPAQPQEIVAKPPPPLLGRMGGQNFPIGSALLMCNEKFNLSTRAKPYENPKSSFISKDAVIPIAPNVPLTLEKSLEPMFQPPKGVPRKSTHNPNVMDSQCYNIVEDLTQAPYAISSWEVLQSFPTKVFLYLLL